MKEKIIAVVGPTASGKTALSIRLAQALDGEIISCDSMQIYRGMCIGTAAPTVEEMAGIPHHLIGILPPSEEFSVVTRQDTDFLRRYRIIFGRAFARVGIFRGGKIRGASS